MWEAGRIKIYIVALQLTNPTIEDVLSNWIEALSRAHETLSATRKPLIPFKQHIAEVAKTQREMIEATRQIEMLVAELDHRVKNTLAVIMSVVTRSVENRREQKVVEGRASGPPFYYDPSTMSGMTSASRSVWKGKSSDGEMV
jgi:hypothetical protein